MNLNVSIAEALRLTRAGDLAAATSLLRTALGGKAARAAPAPRDAVIDLVGERAPVAPRREGHAPAPSPGPGARFEARRHVGPAGGIDYMLYCPASAVPGMPLVVMLHGCTQSPEDFARGTAMNQVADEFGVLVAYPRQTSSANPQRCWNWFRPGDQGRGRGEPALIAGLVHDIVAAERADGARVYVAGLSAGGAAAAIMADAYPELFAAVGIHSGLGCGAARNVPGALAAMKRGATQLGKPRAPGGRFVPVITFHGDRDTVVHEVNSRQIVESVTAAAARPLATEVEAGAAGGRHFTRGLSRDPAGRVLIEQWTIAGAGHAWSGGDPSGSYADAAGPSASRAMIRFFLDHALAEA